MWGAQRPNCLYFNQVVLFIYLVRVKIYFTSIKGMYSSDKVKIQ